MAITAFPINTVLPTASVVTNTTYGFLTATNVQASLQQIVDNTVPITRQVIAGQGLTGGGAFSVDRTLNVGAGTGIAIAADTVGLDTASTRVTDHAAVVLTAGAGLTGGGDLTASRTLTVGAGAGIAVATDSVAIDTAANFTWTGTHNFTGAVTGAGGLEGLYNVKDYGAVGDNIADDTAAIQAAVAAALSPLYGSNKLYGKIFFPPGIYKITSSIAITPGSSGSRGIIFEGCGNATTLNGNFADFIIKTTFAEPNAGIIGARDMAIFNSSNAVYPTPSGAISFVNCLQGPFFENLSVGGMVGIYTGGSFAPRVENCNVAGGSRSHLANSVGISLSSQGGGSIQDCIIRGFNNGVRINSGLISYCDIENNMIGIAAGSNPANSNVGTADGYTTNYLGGAVTILGSAFEANAVGLWVATGRVCTINCTLIADAFCTPETDRLGGLMVTGNVTDGSPIITNILPSTTGMYPQQYVKKTNQSGAGYITSTVDSASQVTLQGNWNSGTATNQVLFVERLARHGIRVQYGNHSTFIGTAVSGPFSDAVWQMDNAGGEAFINCSADSTGGSNVTWDIPGGGWNFIGNFTSFGKNPPDSATSRTYSTLPGSPRDGDEYNIIDCNTVVFRATAAAGGTNHVKVRWDASGGGAWKVAA